MRRKLTQNYFTSSDPHHDISIWHISGMRWNILLAFFLAYLITLFRTWVLASLRTFLLASLLTFFLAYLLTFFLTFWSWWSQGSQHSSTPCGWWCVPPGSMPDWQGNMGLGFAVLVIPDCARWHGHGHGRWLHWSWWWLCGKGGWTLDLLPQTRSWFERWNHSSERSAYSAGCQLVPLI